MRRPAFLALLLAVALPSGGRAAAPTAEDAAAVAAFFASSVPLASASVAVQDVEAPPAVAAAATHALRAELFRLGISVVRPGADADYDLRSLIVPDVPRAAWLASLWRKSDGGLAATYTRALTEREAVAPVTPHGGDSAGRRWKVSAGPHFRGRTIGWVAGYTWACPTRRWEAGVDAGGYSDSTKTSVLGVTTTNRLEVLHVRFHASRLRPVSTIRFLEGWLPSGLVLRGGAGVALVQVQNRVHIEGVPGGAFERENGKTAYLRPVFLGAFRHSLTRRLGAEVGAEWVPDLIGPGDVNLAGFAGSVRLLF